MTILRVVCDSRRDFTRPEGCRAWTLQGNLCKLCYRAIPFDLMVGDHIIPCSRGNARQPPGFVRLLQPSQGE